MDYIIVQNSMQSFKKKIVLGRFAMTEKEKLKGKKIHDIRNVKNRNWKEGRNKNFVN